ncbi:MAG: beta-eliminating lyase-related protein [Candidatus Eremiobacteraeota bacterium]|nr:beta-eliminating lyase-related protein [Candidatus Eremiobacteraeota bacterium]
MREIADGLGGQERPDRYGSGEVLETFERDIAQLLGKECAAFMPSGTMAQQIALRVHAERSGNRNVALHPQSHLLVSEENAFQTLHPLYGVPVGTREALFTLRDLQKTTPVPGTLLVELPERNIGGELRPWNELRDIAAWARDAGVRIHLDGARLWECVPYYERSLAEICDLFDTVYVSFYKTLGAIAGAALAGKRPIIDEARTWQWRHGGRLVAQYPMIVSAQQGLARYAPRIPLYCDRARSIARVLGEFEPVSVTPDPPPTNMMHVFVRGDRDTLDRCALALAQETGIWFAGSWQNTEVPGTAKFELTCAEGSLSIGDDEVRALATRLFATL